jgi:hypothetical protein
MASGTLVEGEAVSITECPNIEVRRRNPARSAWPR